MSFTAIAHRLLKVRPRRGGGVSSYFAGDMGAVESPVSDTIRFVGSSGRSAAMNAVELLPDRFAASGALAASTSIFPLRIASSGRYLETAQGAPFLVHGDTPWSIAVQLTRAQIDTYLDDRKAKGFSAILFNVIEHRFSDNSPAWRNREGNLPFAPMTDFASVNEAYFGLIDYIYSGCLSRDIWPLMNPAYLGFGGGDEGWMSEVTAETASDLQAYGVFLANRYPLAGWCAGGDYGGSTTERAKQWNIFTGIRSVRPAAIITGHGARTQSAYSLWNGYTGFNLNNIYTDGTEYTYAATEYARSGPMPFFLIEGYYEGDDLGTAAACRRQAYVSILSGACGEFSGNKPVWDFGSSVGSGGGVSAALTHLNDTATAQMRYVKELFSAYPWHLLQPKTDGSLVTTSLSSGENRISPSLASDGSFAMVRRPNGGASTINMAALTPTSVRARFFDPTSGSYSDVSGSPFANTGAQSITWPGERILVLDANPQSSFSHGDEVTITGSGFGSMPTFYFAGGAAGPLETTNIGSTPNQGANGDNDGRPAGTMNWFRWNMPGVIVNDADRGKVWHYDGTPKPPANDTVEAAIEYKFPSSIPLSGKYMVKYKALYDVTAGSSGAQVKFARTNAGTTDVQDTSHNMVWTYRDDGGSEKNYMFYVHAAGGTGSQTNYLGTGTNMPAINGIWSSVEQKITAPSAQGTADGRLFYRAIRAGAGSVPSYYSRTNINAYTNSARFTNYMWQNYVGNGMNVSTKGVRLDDIYVSVGTFKCVELWNTNSPSTATIREIQEPTSWSSGSITIRLNKGGLSAGTYYLVVLDDSETDTVLASKQITVK